MELAVRLRRLRERLKLSQEEFGKRIGKSKRTIQHWESGNITPSDRVLSLIEQTFNVNPEWLRHGKGEMFLPKKEVVRPEELREDLLIELTAEKIVNSILEKRDIKLPPAKKRKLVKKLAELIKQIGEKEAIDLIDLAV